MPLPLLLFCFWVLTATVIGLAPTRYHWRGAYVLMATGAPLLVWIWLTQNGWIAAFATFAALSVLRWPVRFVLRWLRQRFTERTE